jgi:uncharacterized protein YkwD
MKRIAIGFVAFLALGSLAQGDAPLDETRVTLRSHILTLINRDRATYGLAPVQLDPNLSLLADEYCRTQIRNRTTGHFTTDGLAPYMRYSFAGVDDGISENAAAWSANYTFSDRALYEMSRRSEDAMMAEAAPHDGHKRTILDPSATHVGIGLAWEKGEFRLVHEFVRHYVDWSRPLPREAALTDRPLARGRALPGAKVEAISVHFEPLPVSMTPTVANAISTYTLPDKRRDYLPRMRDEVRVNRETSEIIHRRYSDGGRGDFSLSVDGTFSFNVPFTEGPGVYTVVVWVRKAGSKTSVPASNVSIRVTQSDYVGTR